ncbi:MAG TPA: hypothetical protein VNE42_01880 [Acidimicrobiales bacterium]|nr:hypothetical protein [Acidimicrobiales bacterium]
MIEVTKSENGRLAPDDTTLEVITRALGDYLAHQSNSESRIRPTWRERRTNWRFSGRAWTGAAHESRDRPRR